MVTQMEIIDMIKCLPESTLEPLAGIINNLFIMYDIDYEFVPNKETLEAFKEIDEGKSNGTLKKYTGTAEEIFAMMDAEDSEEE